MAPRLDLSFFLPIFLLIQAAISLLHSWELIPNFLATIFLCNVTAFAPRDIVHPTSATSGLTALLGAPFAPPSGSFGSYVSRIAQAFIFSRILRPSSSKYTSGDIILTIILAWIPVGLLRAVIGHFFTRSVGWAQPSLFKHWALYETTEGLGAGLVMWVYFRVLSNEHEPIETKRTLNQFKAALEDLLHLHETQAHNDLLTLGLLVLFLAIAEAKPWTYACALLAAGLIRLIFSLVPVTDHDRTPIPSNRPIPTFFTQTFVPTLRLAVIPLFFIGFISLIFSLASFPSTNTTLLPPPPKANKNLLEIVMLSYPRGDSASVEDVENTLTNTIQSFRSLIDPDGQTEQGNMALTVFSHYTDHVAFKNIMDKTDDHDNIQFHVDMDSHSWNEYGSAIHLFLAEALRWVSTVDSRRKWKPAEWIMLTEDDYLLCPDGADALARTMWLLEEGRKQQSENDGPRSAFIGAGASGLIFHHSLIPMLENILRLNAKQRPFTPYLSRRHEGEVIQDCLLGIDPLCARTPGPFSTSPHVGGKPRTDMNNVARQSDSEIQMFIPSRLVMEHRHVESPSSMWKCGWRHVFHGRRGVGVVVV